MYNGLNLNKYFSSNKNKWSVLDALTKPFGDKSWGTTMSKKSYCENFVKSANNHDSLKECSCGTNTFEILLFWKRSYGRTNNA